MIFLDFTPQLQPFFAMSHTKTSDNIKFFVRVTVICLLAMASWSHAITPADIEELQKAAKSGDANAQEALGRCYDNGEGVTKDIGRAFQFYLTSATQGNAEAEVNVGYSYEHGLGVPENIGEAIKWYRKAAEQGHEAAQAFLGDFYYSGNGVPKDLVKAAGWFRSSAEQGCSGGQLRLGICYLEGEGVPRSKIDAYKWLNLGSTKGNQEARNRLLKLEASMTEDQIVLAQRLSSEFKPKTTISGTSENQSVIPSDQPKGSGTGFFITKDGFAMTNAHVVKEGTKFKVVTASGSLDAKVIRVDSANDLALLKVSGEFAALPIVSSKLIRLGGTVATVGFPNPGMQGFAPKLSKGEIAAMSGPQDDGRYFQISVPVQPGNSGGPLVDERGNVVGVVSAKLDASAAWKATGALPEAVNYAVKSSFVLSFLESVPEVNAGMIEAKTKDIRFEDVVSAAQQSAVLVLVY